MSDRRKIMLEIAVILHYHNHHQYHHKNSNEINMNIINKLDGGINDNNYKNEMAFSEKKSYINNDIKNDNDLNDNDSTENRQQWK